MQPHKQQRPRGSVSWVPTSLLGSPAGVVRALPLQLLIDSPTLHTSGTRGEELLGEHGLKAK